MSSWMQFATTTALSLAISLTAGAFMRNALFDVLWEVCGKEVSARFWTAYALVMIVVAPLFLVTTFVRTSDDPVGGIRTAVAVTAMGLIAAFVLMGLAVPRRKDTSPAEHTAEKTEADHAHFDPRR